MLGAALAAAAAAAPASVDFPCDKLGDGVELFDGLEESQAPPPRAVEVRKKAILFERRQGLVAPSFTLSGAGLANSGGTASAPVLFRKYRSGAEMLFCTGTWSEALFGAGDAKTRFMLRCLVDKDGDGAFESFVHRLQLVPYNMRTGRTSAPTGEAPGLLPLPRPVTLVPAAAPARPDPFSSAEVLTRISVARVDGGNVELRFSGGVRRGSSSFADRMMGGAETIVAVPMTEGAEVPILGTRIRFARRAGKWTAAVLDGFGRPPRLLCSGAVVEAGDTFTILTPGGQASYARADLRP
jgi:hypothetical protein